MDEKDKKEVENMILEAKLDISESRFKLILYLAGGFLALFGVILPIFLSLDSSGKVDKAIEKMETSFKELAGTQLWRPEIECYLQGKKLENTTWSSNQGERFSFEIKNIGKAIAKDIQFYLYVPEVQGTDIILCLGDWHSAEKSIDEPVFSKSYKHVYHTESLNPKESFSVPLCFNTKGGKECKASVLLKIYYGQPEPKRISFNIRIKSK